MTDAAWTLHWLEAEGSLAPWGEAVEREIAATLDIVARLVAPPRLDILVQALPGRVIPETGMGGHAFRATMLSIELDPANTNFTASMAGCGLRRLLAHEVHHCLRWAAAGYGGSLGEALVSEGLAGHFVRHLFGSGPEPWECAIEDAALRAHAPGRDELAGHDYDHDAWFYGVGRYPRWLGYTLGYRIVGEWLDGARVAEPDWVGVTAADVLRSSHFVAAEGGVAC